MQRVRDEVHWSSALAGNRALARWAANHASPAAAFEACPHGDWLLWALAEFGAQRQVLILCACDCARTVLPLLRTGEELAREAIETAEAWAKDQATGRACQRAGVVTDAQGHQLRAAGAVAHAAALAAQYWESRNLRMSNQIAEVASLAASTLARTGVPYDVHSRELADLVRARRFPLRQPSATEIRRSDALAVAWDRLSEEVDEGATLSAVQVLSSWWTALSLGLDDQRPIDPDSLVIRAVAERLQLVPHHLPTVKAAIAAALET